MPLTQEERTAYLALSHLFLDNEMDDIDFRAIVHRLSGVHISITRMEYMLRHHLFPLLFMNFFLTIAADAFDEEWLIDKIEARVSSPPWFMMKALEAVVWYALSETVKPDWEELKQRLANRRLAAQPMPHPPTDKATPGSPSSLTRRR
ncbi:hypothetical protein BD410DRAFT_785608 [Rickenella mellea]|uniref:DUF7079 domain-containing protein n=1 Tax=Rickenella mellea TaxID=50990 RepID=A0A4Y7QBR6_9AGAM|nr:hypothetical protein BD410DRAFT_785608 [Rickenella mellea]